MSYNDFIAAEIAIGQANKKSVWQKLKDNFSDHESRIAATEG